ncbi:LexA family protein [Marinomonas sp.]|uniref:LexA family protein n=1 Tax=Marinomonas sp. TaxID=1904862 RepID=UPI003F99E818
MTAGERILMKRKEYKLSIRALCKLLGGISPATVSMWEQDRNKPNGENLNNLAKIFKTSTTWLLTGENGNNTRGLESNVEAAPFQRGSKRLPILSNVQAGMWTEALDYRALGLDVEYEEAPITASDHAFWLRVIGDSMTSPSGISITEGMLILVDPEEDIINGSLVVAKLEGTDEATFKKLVIDAGMKSLRPLNPTYPPIPINGNCQIIGVVKEAKVKF